MAKISTQNVQPGMIVKKDIKDKNGRLLLPQNSQLEEKHIRILKIWGIYEVDIDQAEEEEEKNLQSSNLTVQDIKYASKIIRPKYANTNTNHPCIREIFKQNALLIAQKVSEGEDIENAGAINLPNKEEFQEQRYTLPDIFYRITEIINNPRTSARDIAQVVEKDTALTARMLKLVNSPFYGFPQKIETISKAVTVIGTKQLSMLALGISVTKLFSEVPSTYLDMQKFWKHCLGVGICAKLISEHMDYSESEKLFVAGILHDIGRLIMLKKIPQQTAMALKYTWDNDSFLSKAERQCIGFTHTKLGSELCTNWKIPPLLVDIVTYHHNPTQAKYSLECSILHLAELIVNALDIGTSGEKMVLYLNEKAWENLNISSKVIVPIVEQLRNELDVILEILK